VKTSLLYAHPRRFGALIPRYGLPGTFRNVLLDDRIL
jgi:hypothetical protein